MTMTPNGAQSEQEKAYNRKMHPRMEWKDVEVCKRKSGWMSAVLF